MSNKLVLLPMDLYRGLLKPRESLPTTGAEDLREYAPLKYEEAQLQKVKRQKRKNLSTKNVLLNQQLRRYLRARKEARDKPVKLKLSNEQELLKLLKKGTTKEEPVKMAVVKEDGELEHVKVEEIKPTVHFPKAEEEVFQTPPNTTHFAEKTPRKESTAGTNGSSSAIIPDTTPRGKFPKRSDKKLAAEEAVKQREKKLFDLINQNPARFGISEEGEIINPMTGKPFVRSNIKWAVQRLVNPQTSNAPSPPGMAHLRKKLFVDEETRPLLHESYQTGKGKPQQQNKKIFRPAKWKK